MIDFHAFSDELQKIAQPNFGHAQHPTRRKVMKALGAAGGATAGAAGGSALARGANPKLRLAAMLAGGGLGALGGKNVGGGLHRAVA